MPCSQSMLTLQPKTEFGWFLAFRGSSQLQNLTQTLYRVTLWVAHYQCRVRKKKLKTDRTQKQLEKEESVKETKQMSEFQEENQENTGVSFTWKGDWFWEGILNSVRCHKELK